MADRSPDPTPSQLLEACRNFRLKWTEEEREEALAYAPAAAVTDLADDVYIEALERGDRLTVEECFAELNSRPEEPDPVPRTESRRHQTATLLTDHKQRQNI